jgi:hypothetical protein
LPAVRAAPQTEGKAVNKSLFPKRAKSRYQNHQRKGRVEKAANAMAKAIERERREEKQVKDGEVKRG